jgi:hypothetical protein
MSDDDGRRRRPSALRRAWRWKPAGHLRVWLLAASGGLIVLAILAALGRPLIGLVAELGVALGFGTAQGYRLERRTDAGVAPDWAAARFPGDAES